MIDDLGAMGMNLAGLLPSEVGRNLDLAKGQLVFATSDPTRGLFLVQSGLVRLVRRAADGNEITLHIARPGQFFAEASLFTECYHCDAVADLPSRLLAFGKEQVLTALCSDPNDALRWIQHLSRQIQKLRAQAALLCLNSADDRVLSFLRTQCWDGPEVIVDRPWKTIASELGLTHETLYRTLARLERRGLIKRDRQASTVELRPDRSR